MSITIKVRGDIDKAIRLLKKKVQRDGIQSELRRRRFHEKPSIRKRRKRSQAARRKKRTDRFNMRDL